MPVLTCAGANCRRFISVSQIPGGNPTALADPERFSTQHVACAACGKRFCDRCVAPGSPAPPCPRCGKLELTVP